MAALLDLGFRLSSENRKILYGLVKGLNSLIPTNQQ